ncbi:MAG: signal transduction histidine kinase [Planctomycetota bacterium]|jgi:signal transduction histidine kinase
MGIPLVALEKPQPPGLGKASSARQSSFTMIPATSPTNEAERLAALKDLEVLDSEFEPEFDALVNAASRVAGVPISLISLVDRDRQWFKASVGLVETSEVDRESAFCSHTILESVPMEVTDAAKDERFHDNPFVVGSPKVRFYCGVPLTLRSGLRVGTLCVIDHVPRKMDETQLEILGYLATAASAALEGRKAALDLARKSARLKESEIELLAANSILVRANDDLESFVRVASHDLRSPLITISRLADWICEDLGDDCSETVREHTSLIQRRITRMDSLLTALRQFTLAGHVDAPLETVDTEEVVRAAFELNSDDGHVRLELDGDLPRIVVQAVPLELVLRNLIGNAIKFAPESGAFVKVGAREINAGVEFTVTDNGPGIAPEFHDAVFDHFQLLQSRDKYEGSGLGLTFVKRAVELAGGHVELESDGLCGSTFRFTWPAQIVGKPADKP